MKEYQITDLGHSKLMVAKGQNLKTEILKEDENIYYFNCNEDIIDVYIDQNSLRYGC